MVLYMAVVDDVITLIVGRSIRPRTPNRDNWKERGRERRRLLAYYRAPYPVVKGGRFERDDSITGSSDDYRSDGR
jgi:hypothetical protein